MLDALKQGWEYCRNYDSLKIVIAFIWLGLIVLQCILIYKLLLAKPSNSQTSDTKVNSAKVSQPLADTLSTETKETLSTVHQVKRPPQRFKETESATSNTGVKNSKNNFDGGTGNTYKQPIHVGDIYTGPQFDDQHKIELIQRIEYLFTKTEYREIGIFITMESNGAKVAYEIESFLKSKGYKASIAAQVSGQVKGVAIGIDEMFKAITITVGVL